MSQRNLIAKSVGLKHTEPVPIDEIAARVRRGEVIVLPNCMQALGYFEQLRAASLEGIRQAVGEEKAAQVRAEGFEALHQIVEVNELTSIVLCTDEILRSLSPTLAKIVVEGVFQTNSPFYFAANPNVCCHTPFDELLEKEELSQCFWSGKITPCSPHQDSWYEYPTNSINIWIAVGAVRLGNGLSIYPQVYGKSLCYTEDGRILPDRCFGRALNFELEPGDVIVFQGEHLHGSEINSTDETCHAIGFRLTLDRPKFLTQSPHKFIYFGSSSLMAKLAQLPLKVSRRLAELAQLLGVARLAKPLASATKFDETSADFPRLLLAKAVADRAMLVFNASELTVGEIRPISQQLCAARLGKYWVVVFSRHCPHEGADLAAGYVQDGCIVCPWHNLPFSMNSGASPCMSLPRLTVFDYSESINKDEQHTTSIC